MAGFIPSLALIFWAARDNRVDCGWPLRGLPEMQKRIVTVKKKKIQSPTLPIVIMFGLFILIGAVMIIFGLRGTWQLEQTTRSYAKTTGYLTGYILQAEEQYDAVKKEHTAATYYLVYSYAVGQGEYRVVTDYATSILPAMGTSAQIRYAPDDPERAVIVGPNKNAGLLFIGGMFAVIPSVLLWIILKPVPKKGRLDTTGLAFGLIFVVFGYGALYMTTGEYSLSGIIRFYQTSFILPLVIPPLLICAGLFASVRSLLGFAALKKRGKARRGQKATPHR